MTIPDATVRELRALLRRAEHQPHMIALLTDEELVALEKDVASTPHPSPWIAESPGVNRELAGRFGVRSLLARGLLRETVAAPGTPPVLDVPPEVRVVLDTRRVGLGYIRAVRPAGSAGSSKIVVVQPELGTFEEEISDQGFHLFTACNYDDATARLARWCVPHPGVRSAGGAATIALSEWPRFLRSELPDAQVTDLSIELFLPGPSGTREPDSWLVAYSASVSLLARATSSERLEVRPISRDRLRDLLDDRVAHALQHVRHRSMS